MQRQVSSLWLAASLLAALAPESRADVLVVEPAGGPGAPVLQAAIDAATSGDVLLLRPGDYASTLLDHSVVAGKALALLADAGGARIELHGLTIRDAGGPVVLRGLRVAPPAGQSLAEGALVIDNVDTVWIEDCAFAGADGNDLDDLVGGTSGVFARDVSRIVMSRCSVTGGRGVDGGTAANPWAIGGAPGMRVENADVTLADSQVTGGDGGDGPHLFVLYAHGGPGVYTVNAASLWVTGCTLTGGAEGNDNAPQTMPGSGLQVVNTTLRLRDSDVQAGEINGDGTPAQDITTPLSILIEYPAPARRLSVPAPLRANEPSSLTITGLPGDLPWLLASPDQGKLVSDYRQGVLYPSIYSLSAIPLGAITDPSGVLVVPFVTPPIPGGAEDARAFLQTLHVAGDPGTLGSPTMFLWIDAAF